MYFVNRERMSLNSVSSVVPTVQFTSLGIPLSYQRTATRTNLNPPPRERTQAVLKRLTFTTTKCHKGQVVWKKLGFEVILLDAKHLPVMGGETTNGKLL